MSVRTYVVQHWGMDVAEFPDTEEGFDAAVRKLEDMRANACRPTEWELIYRTERKVNR